MKVKEIVIESESKGHIIGGQEKTNDNSDIDVILEDGTVYSATAFTFENIRFLREENSKTGECLSGRYFWAKDMLLVSQIERREIETIINHLIREGEFHFVFKRVDSCKSVWVFNSINKLFSGGVFEDLVVAEEWIMRNKLTGILTKYPLDQGALDWAVKNGLVNMKPEKLKEKKVDPDFIGGFTSASMEHYHYESGNRE
ncbi:DUF7710 domain-containing protein [Rufibacter hautae]|uniref:DUF7710 domain-containing protein n=1 Tax=Rufibacter hautae TaxID=2595005 RepID=UPI001CC1D088|nr:hypothetical protein [Rufibacter hautae]